MRDGELKVITWESISDTDDGTTFIADYDNIRIRDDGMVISIAFVPSGTDVGMPPWAPDLPDLAISDSGQLSPDDLFGGTSVPGAEPSSDSPADTEPASGGSTDEPEG
jgi:hypothetical protein